MAVKRGCPAWLCTVVDWPAVDWPVDCCASLGIARNDVECRHEGSFIPRVRIDPGTTATVELASRSGNPQNADRPAP